MRNFSFYNPTRIHFGEGQIDKLAREIPAGSRVLVTHGGGSIFQNGVWQQVEQALAGYALTRFAGIEANPQFDTLVKAVELARREGCDFILAVGGGSVIDGSKFIAAALCHEGDPLDLLTGTRAKAALPLGCVLTLAATGSESNPHGVVTHVARQEKLPFSSPLLYPRFAILDPCTTFSLPARQIGNGVVDAFVHTLEQYLTYPADAPLQDRQAEGLLLTLIEEGPRALANPEDYTARANLMWCATQALNGLLGCGVPQDWATHMIGHELTALYHLDHAQTLAVVLPALLAERREPKRAKLIQYAERVWGIEGDEDTKIDGAIAATRDFFQALGVPTRLADHGLDAEVIPQVLAQLERHGMTALSERRDLDLEASERILLRAL
ncbi:alcohol dehydrogenase [Pseudomonas sp. No.21]|uniref:iron-containing alcohol dehydrogenase n=1 Tax=Pseudomonas TaxID=286 RepID=UPI000DA98ED5|nr:MULTISPECIES: iron-containing alcohol dehydrogenase [Pseudomonas]MDW3712848.1 iron-containing alcohol dehydrogenase [Pseudomonas sp. 2023EL-01195]PZE12786.1 NADH-dependent alcohol dehydrogenase [Pseudomonas sp. 57B-090624]GJN44981.1 NADH-dependent alcohol dehydrogenase [Pseudomonas tohonis]